MTIKHLRTKLHSRFIGHPNLDLLKSDAFLPLQRTTRWAVAAMDRRVTTIASAPHRGCRLDSGGLPMTDLVALEAQPRAREF